MNKKIHKSQYLNCGILQKQKLILLILSVLLCQHALFAQERQPKSSYKIYIDQKFEHSPKGFHDSLFKDSKGVIPDMGWGKIKAWVGIPIEIQKREIKYVLIQNPVFDEITIYFTNGNSETIKPGTLLKDRKVSFRYPTFILPDTGIRKIYISGIATLNPAKFPIRLLSESGFSKLRENQALRNGLILGLISIIVVLNIIIFIIFRLRAFGVFALSASLYALLYLFLEGYLFGQSFTSIFFENPYFNFHYFIYFGFQLSNYWVFSSVFQIEIRKINRLYTVYRILIFVALVEGLVMFLSPMWYEHISHETVKIVGMTLRIGAAIMNMLIMLLLLRIRNENSLAQWFLLAIIPGWLSYLLPRFVPILFQNTWYTMPQLYSISVVWYTAMVSLGLATKIFKNRKAELDVVLDEEKKQRLPLSDLSQRETDILMAFTNGFSYTEISDAMFISPHTVRTHLKNIYGKIGVNSKAEAVRWVLQKDYRT